MICYLTRCLPICISGPGRHRCSCKPEFFPPSFTNIFEYFPCFTNEKLFCHIHLVIIKLTLGALTNVKCQHECIVKGWIVHIVYAVHGPELQQRWISSLFCFAFNLHIFLFFCRLILIYQSSELKHGQVEVDYQP